MKLYKTIFPKSLKSILIRNCASVSIDNPSLGDQLELDLLSIIGVDKLSIKTGILKKIDQIFFESIHLLQIDSGAFEELVADKILFLRVNFSDHQMQKFHQVSTLEYIKSDLTQVANIEALNVSSVGFYGCQIGHQLNLNIKTTDLFAMSDNIFHQLPISNRLMEIHYRNRVELASNWLSINQGETILLPQIKASSTSPSFFTVNVYSSHQHIERVSELIRWWASFNFAETESSFYWPSCKVNQLIAYLNIKCDNVDAMNSFIKSDRFNSTLYSQTAYSNASSVEINNLNIYFFSALTFLIKLILPTTPKLVT